MGFNLFKKQSKDDDNFDQIIGGPPALDFPQRPDEDFVPKPPEMDNFASKKERIDAPAPDFLKMPVIDDPINRPKKMELPKIELNDELPEFPDEQNSEDGGNAPIPPSYFAKMGSVRKDMAKEYIEDDDMNVNMVKKPIFVEVDDYKRLRRTISSIEKDAKKSKEISESLKEIKEKKERKLSGWDKQLENIQRNMIFADKMLFEEGGPNV